MNYGNEYHESDIDELAEGAATAFRIAGIVFAILALALIFLHVLPRAIEGYRHDANPNCDAVKCIMSIGDNK